MAGVRVRVVADHRRQVKAIVHAAAARAVVEVCEDALAEINGTGRVPYEEGTLERSGEVQPFPDKTAAAVTYDTPYAAKQHEDPTLHHPRQGEHHWLERTIDENAARYFRHIGDRIRQATRG